MKTHRVNHLTGDNPEQSRRTTKILFSKTRSNSDPIKFKRIQTQTVFPSIELSPSKKPQKTLKTVLSNLDRKHVLRMRQQQNLDILNSYIDKKKTIEAVSIVKLKKVVDDNIRRCYSQEIVESALHSLLVHRNLLSKMNSELLHVKVKNCLKNLNCYDILIDFLSDIRDTQDIMFKIFGGDDADYDMAREVVKAQQSIKVCILSHQERQLSEIKEHLKEERTGLVSLFNNLNYKMVRKSTDYKRRMMLAETLKKIDLDDFSFVHAVPPSVGDGIRKEEERVGRFDKINQLVLNQQKLISQQTNQIQRHT